jgi:hypothetical protein
MLTDLAAFREVVLGGTSRSPYNRSVIRAVAQIWNLSSGMATIHKLRFSIRNLQDMHPEWVRNLNSELVDITKNCAASRTSVTKLKVLTPAHKGQVVVATMHKPKFGMG